MTFENSADLLRKIVEDVNGEYVSCAVAKDKWDKSIDCLKRVGFEVETDDKYRDTHEVYLRKVGEFSKESMARPDYFQGCRMWYSIDHHRELIRITIKGEIRTGMYARKFKVEWLNNNCEISKRNGVR